MLYCWSNIRLNQLTPDTVEMLKTMSQSVIQDLYTM